MFSAAWDNQPATRCQNHNTGNVMRMEIISALGPATHWPIFRRRG
jgi:hypothetical protein